MREKITNYYVKSEWTETKSKDPNALMFLKGSKGHVIHLDEVKNDIVMVYYFDTETNGTGSFIFDLNEEGVLV